MKASPHAIHMARTKRRERTGSSSRQARTHRYTARISKSATSVSAESAAAPAAGKSDERYTRPATKPVSRSQSAAPMPATRSTVAQKATALARRAPQPFTPATWIPAAIAQYAIGGFVQWGRPASVGSR